MLIVCLYVDDFILKVDMFDLSLMHYFLGMEVEQGAGGIFISQKTYIQEILSRFGMMNCNFVGTPVEYDLKLSKDPEEKNVDSTLYKQIMGSLMYLTNTRHDIMYYVNLISRYMENPKEITSSSCQKDTLLLERDHGVWFVLCKGEIDGFGCLFRQ